MPARPNNSRRRILFPISSATPQENPIALLARFEVVSISLNDFIFLFKSYKPIDGQNFLIHLAVVRLETCIFLATYLILDQISKLQRKIVLI